MTNKSSSSANTSITLSLASSSSPNKPKHKDEDTEIVIKRPVEIPESATFNTVSEDAVRSARFSSSWSLTNANNLSPVASGKIAVSLSENANLNSLCISGCDADSATLREMFRGLLDGWNARGKTRFNHTLKRLDISGNFLKRGEYIETSTTGQQIFKLSTEAMDSLKTILSRAINLRVLVLRKNQITFKDVGHILDPLSTHRRLHVLDLSSNNFGPNIALPLAHFVRLVSKSLRALCLRGCYIRDLGVKLLCKPVTHGRAMHTLDLASNDITDSGAKLLAEALNTLNAPCLERLDLSRNKIGSKGMSHLAVPLKLIRLPLRWLDLSYNTFGGGQGLLDFMKSIKQNRAVEWLGMSYCKVVSRDFQKKIQYRPPSLHDAPELEGLRSIASMLRENTALIRLDLRGNGITRRVQRILDDALRDVPTAIPMIGLIREEIDRRCRAVLKRNPTYPRAAARWVRIRLYRNLLPMLEERREVLIV